MSNCDVDTFPLDPGSDVVLDCIDFLIFALFLTFIKSDDMCWLHIDIFTHIDMFSLTDHIPLKYFFLFCHLSQHKFKFWTGIC